MNTQAFANILTLFLVLTKLLFGWPGTWLLAFTPLWVTWGIWAILWVVGMTFIFIGLVYAMIMSS